MSVSSAGAITAVFALRAVRKTPLEPPILALAVLFVGLTLYHLLLLVYPSYEMNLHLVKSITFTAMTGFVLLMIYLQTRIDDGVVGIRR
ncbi:MAG: hypothetical protein ABEJ31_10055 [Haloarculaceae archaeon]